MSSNTQTTSNEWEERILTWMVQSQIDNGHQTLDITKRRNAGHTTSDLEFGIYAFASMTRASNEMDKLLAVIPPDPPWDNEVTIRSKTDGIGVPYISITVHCV